MAVRGEATFVWFRKHTENRAGGGMVLDEDGAELRRLFRRFNATVLGTQRILRELSWNEDRLRQVATSHKRFRMIILNENFLGVRYHPDQ